MCRSASIDSHLCSRVLSRAAFHKQFFFFFFFFFFAAAAAASASLQLKRTLLRVKMSHTAAVFGIDLGEKTCKVGRAHKQGVDVILNESSNRLTPWVAAPGRGSRAPRRTYLAHSPRPVPLPPSLPSLCCSAVVSFKGEERFLGEAGNTQVRARFPPREPRVPTPRVLTPSLAHPLCPPAGAHQHGQHHHLH